MSKLETKDTSLLAELVSDCCNHDPEIVLKITIRNKPSAKDTKAFATLVSDWIQDLAKERRNG